MNCQCVITRYFVDGSVSTARNTGKWSYNCTKCHLRVMQTPKDSEASHHCPERFTTESWARRR